MTKLDMNKVLTLIGYAAFFLNIVAMMNEYISFNVFYQISICILIYAGIRLFINSLNETEHEKNKIRLTSMFFIMVILGISNLVKYNQLIKDEQNLENVCEIVNILSYTEIGNLKGINQMNIICEDKINYAN